MENPMIPGMPEVIGQSEPFMQVIQSIRQVAPTDITVLITGESGTGKEMIARAIHQLSPRVQKSMLTVNCGAIPEGILESELFGHEKGSFTGAVDSRKGYFELADGGTLFLDEIGEMPLGTQVKLLRVLEGKEFMRVGGAKSMQMDVRVLAATNKELEDAVRRQEFRQDLFYRLNAVKITVPPLRRRKSDIRQLAIHFADQVCLNNKIKFQGFTEDGFEAMENYTWPGNIRELRNLVERMIVLEKGRKIDASVIDLHIQKETTQDHHLPMVVNKTTDQAERELIYRALLDIRMALEDIRRLIVGYYPRRIGEQHHASAYQTEISSDAVIEPPEPDPTLQDLEIEQIKKMLIKYRGNRRKVAKALGIGERTLYRKLKEYHLE